jgi:hypothetical protein
MFEHLHLMGDSTPVAHQHGSRLRTEARITLCFSTIRCVSGDAH